MNLTETIRGLEVERAKIEAAIVALQALAANGNGNGQVKAAKVPAPSTGRRGKTSPPDADTLTRMRQQYEHGAKLEHIAKSTGVAQSTVYRYATNGKWKRGKRGAPAVAGEVLSGRVRCQECEQMTPTDPCASCGAQVRP